MKKCWFCKTKEDKEFMTRINHKGFLPDYDVFICYICEDIMMKMCVRSIMLELCDLKGVKDYDDKNDFLEILEQSIRAIIGGKKK